MYDSVKYLKHAVLCWVLIFGIPQKNTSTEQKYEYFMMENYYYISENSSFPTYLWCFHYFILRSETILLSTFYDYRLKKEYFQMKPMEMDFRG